LKNLLKKDACYAGTLGPRYEVNNPVLTLIFGDGALDGKIASVQSQSLNLHGLRCTRRIHRARIVILPENHLMAAFVGDGSAPGDGGAMLQKLWEKFPWRPINGMPGSWSMKRVGDGVPPEALCSTCGISSVQAKKLKDDIIVIEFADGGGLLTLVKQDGTYFHTLLTKSALSLRMA